MKKTFVKNLTNREYEIMQVLWNENSPLIATEILSLIDDNKLSIFTVQNNLKALVKKGFIEINSFTIVNKSNTRRYSAKISADEYAVECFKHYYPKKGKSKASLSDLMLSLLKVEHANADKTELDKIEKLIAEERRKLKSE